MVFKASNIAETESVAAEIAKKLENGGYHVSLEVFDMDTQLLKITLYVADERQIEIVKDNFYNNAVTIYSDVISSLTVE